MSTALDQLLSRHPDRVWRGRQGKSEGTRIGTGYSALDAAIGGGWPTGTLVEILAAGLGLGRASLLLPALAALTRGGRTVAWLPEQHEQPYPPALMQSGIDLRRVLIMVVAGQQERLWAAEQSLHSGSCGALVLAEQAGHAIDDTSLRRLKLAAAAGGSLAFLLRDEGTARRPSPAPLRIRVRGEPYTPRRYLSVLKCGSHPPRGLTLDLDAQGR